MQNRNLRQSALTFWITLKSCYNFGRCLGQYVVSQQCCQCCCACVCFRSTWSTW